MRLLLLPVFLPLFSLAQTFEVATVKISQLRPGGAELGGGPFQEFFTARGDTLFDLLGIAYGIKDPLLISGPDWLRTETYDVSAKMPPGTGKPEFQGMLQNLLTERFKLKIHHQTKTEQVFDLVVLKNGHRFQPPGATAPLAANGSAFPDLPADKPGLSWNGRRLAARQQSLQPLRNLIRSAVDRPIVDKTELKGVYDYWLEFNPRPTTGPPGAFPDVFEALARQLGLQLVDGKQTYDSIVVDSGEKVPTEN